MSSLAPTNKSLAQNNCPGTANRDAAHVGAIARPGACLALAPESVGAAPRYARPRSVLLRERIDSGRRP
jgi:hypothetical protein